jgi:predicted dehydrogenase
MDVGCYCVNICRTLAGMEPVTVFASANWAPTGVDELMVANLVFPDGILAQFTCGFVLDRSQHYQVMGTDGTIALEMGAFLSGGRDIRIRGQKMGQPLELGIPGADEYQLMVEHFADCILHDRPVRYGTEDAAANMRVIKALLRSASRSGQPEVINAVKPLE